MKTKWRPMRTAPKTGEDILVWFPRDEQAAIVRWDGDEHAWTGGDGFLYIDDNLSGWLPLPAGPKEAVK